MKKKKKKLFSLLFLFFFSSFLCSSQHSLSLFFDSCAPVFSCARVQNLRSSSRSSSGERCAWGSRCWNAAARSGSGARGGAGEGRGGAAIEKKEKRERLERATHGFFSPSLSFRHCRRSRAAQRTNCSLLFGGSEWTLRALRKNAKESEKEPGRARNRGCRRRGVHAVRCSQTVAKERERRRRRVSGERSGQKKEKKKRVPLPLSDTSCLQTAAQPPRVRREPYTGSIRKERSVGVSFVPGAAASTYQNLVDAENRN